MLAAVPRRPRLSRSLAAGRSHRLLGGALALIALLAVAAAVPVPSTGEVAATLLESLEWLPMVAVPAAVGGDREQ